MSGNAVMATVCAVWFTLGAIVASHAAAENQIVYKPPAGATEVVRVDGTVRGGGDSMPSLYLLAPEHVGLTTREQPSIFWFQSKPVKTRIELTLVQDKRLVPVCEIHLDEVPRAGIQRLRLADYGVRLAVGIEYRCTVALVVDESSRSRDIVASSIIKRVEPFPTLKARLAAAAFAEKPFIYASEGIWFDSIEELAELIETGPDPRRFHRQRSALLEQVKLADAAAHEARLARMN